MPKVHALMTRWCLQYKTLKMKNIPRKFLGFFMRHFLSSKLHILSLRVAYKENLSAVYEVWADEENNINR